MPWEWSCPANRSMSSAVIRSQVAGRSQRRRARPISTNAFPTPTSRPRRATISFAFSWRCGTRLAISTPHQATRDYSGIAADGKKVDVLAGSRQSRRPGPSARAGRSPCLAPRGNGRQLPWSLRSEADPMRKLHFGYGGPIDKKPPELPLCHLDARDSTIPAGGQVVVRLLNASGGRSKDQLPHFSVRDRSHFLILRR